MELKAWIKQHPIVAFFAITFAISWGLWIPLADAFRRGADFLFPLLVIAVCGPALAAIIVAALSNTEERLPKTRVTTVSFLLAWIVSTLVFLAYNIFINHAPFSPGMAVFVLVSVVPVPFVVSRAFSRTPSVKRLVSSLVKPRGGVVWYLLALLLKPILMCISIPVSTVLDRGTGSTASLPAFGWEFAGLVLTVFLYQFFFFNATGEEVGWRGFALPRLQAKTSPLIACLVIGLLWAPWHAPLWYAQGAPIFTWDFWITRFLIIVPSSVISGWLYNRSRGSILVAGIAHAMSNTLGNVVVLGPQLDERSIGLTWLVFAVLLVVLDKMWEKLPSDHPAVYRSPGLAAQGVCERLERADAKVSLLPTPGEQDREATVQNEVGPDRSPGTSASRV
jgi:membrane protease YdiL (CAAX protease family)